MKRCSYCGKEYADAMNVCPADGSPLQSTEQTASPKSPVSANVATRDEISPEEKQLWERMNFRQFAILMIRLQAVWLLFDAAMQIPYILRYTLQLSDAHSYSVAAIKHDIFW